MLYEAAGLFMREGGIAMLEFIGGVILAIIFLPIALDLAKRM